jgi:hypothetical protein
MEAMREVVPGQDAPLHRGLGGRGQADRQRAALGRVGNGRDFPGSASSARGRSGPTSGPAWRLRAPRCASSCAGDLAAVRARGSVLIQRAGPAPPELRPVAAFGSAAEVGRSTWRRRPEDDTSADHAAGRSSSRSWARTGDPHAPERPRRGRVPGGPLRRRRVIGGLVFMAINRTGPGEVRCFHPGHGLDRRARRAAGGPDPGARPAPVPRRG